MRVKFPFRGADDPWLGAILGRPAIRLRPVGDNGRDQILRRLQTEEVFATAKIELDQIGALKVLQAVGCYVVDVNLAFSVATRGVLVPPGRIYVRDAVPADRDVVRDIAASAFHYSRFHLDPAIPDELANRIKSEWAANFFAGGRGDCLLVATGDGGKVEGFLLSLAAEQAMVIDLIAVSPSSAGRGFGRALVGTIAQRAGQKGKPRISVGTQAANAAAARFYETLGFRLQSAQYVLHHHGVSDRYSVLSTP